MPEEDKNITQDELYAKLLAIAREPVESTNVVAYGYDKLMKVITVEFYNNSVYAYMNCSEKEFSDFEAAESKGKFVHAKLKAHETIKLT